MSHLHAPPSVHDAGLLRHVANRRRAAPGFVAGDVPPEVIDAALRVAGQAPSGYNFQPWRFLVLRDPRRRAALREAALGQSKITEAPVVILAFARRDHWADPAGDILETSARQRGADVAAVPGRKRSALDFIGAIDPVVWLNRHVMIAFTHLMLAFEFHGWDTAPMEGFDPDKVRAALGLPDDALPIALLAVGRDKNPDTPHPGRLPLCEIAFDDTLDRPWGG